MSEHEHIPNWVVVGEGARIHPSVVFIPHENKKSVIGKRTIVDSGSVIYGGVEIGNDCIIGHNTVVRFNVSVGYHTTIANLCMLEGNITVGHHTLIHSNNHVGQKTTIGNYVFMAPLCVTTNDPKMYYYRKEYSLTGEHWRLLKGPTIMDGARIAVAVKIFPGIVIGKQAVLGAGALVVKDVPDYAIVYGVPAVIRGYVDPEKDSIVECKRDHS
jgi:acetyltransferase-like isoleucine patch superfamily enzyme